MAFFKFPWAAEPQESGKGSSRRGRAPQAASIEELRRRARHRLIGAVVLVLVGVIVFPMIFDTQPRTVPVNVAIDIPDRAAAPPMAADRPVTEPAPAPATAGLAPGEEQVEASPAAKAPAEPPHVEAPAKPEAKPEPKAEPKAEPKPESKAPAHAEPKPAAPAGNNDGARARALLEGSAPAAVASAAAPAANAKGERFIVQVGAYADPGKVREVRARLERAGIKTYAQDVQAKGGVSTTRVRIGPFPSRAEAGKVLDRVKGLGLDGVVLTL